VGSGHRANLRRDLARRFGIPTHGNAAERRKSRDGQFRDIGALDAFIAEGVVAKRFAYACPAIHGERLGLVAELFRGRGVALAPFLQFAPFSQIPFQIVGLRGSVLAEESTETSEERRKMAALLSSGAVANVDCISHGELVQLLRIDFEAGFDPQHSRTSRPLNGIGHMAGQLSGSAGRWIEHRHHHRKVGKDIEHDQNLRALAIVAEDNFGGPQFVFARRPGEGNLRGKLLGIGGHCVPSTGETARSWLCETEEGLGVRLFALRLSSSGFSFRRDAFGYVADHAAHEPTVIRIFESSVREIAKV
jgi:hypothetical protein